MVRVYRKKNFSIYSNKHGSFIIHNMNKEFSEGHTHINNFNTAKFILNLALHSTIPNHTISDYLLVSLQRISNDKDYIKRLGFLIKKQ